MAKKPEIKKAKSIKVRALVDCYVNKRLISRDQEVIIAEDKFNKEIFELADGKAEPAKKVEPPATGLEAQKAELKAEAGESGEPSESDEDIQEGELIL